MNIGIINYGMGNINSVVSALKYLGVSWRILETHHDFQSVSCFILPGVGSFKKAMQNLNKKNLSEEIKNQVLIKKKKILGICLGMQLLGNSSTEDGLNEGLSFINNKVDKFNFETNDNLSLPHVGFNNLSKISDNFELFKNIEKSANFYFVHSYKMNFNKNIKNFALCRYGNDFLAAFQKENIFGVQFHPEKSQSNGIQLIYNFIKL